MASVDSKAIRRDILDKFSLLDSANRQGLLHELMDRVIQAPVTADKQEVVGGVLDPDAIESFIGMFDDDITDLSTTVNETLEAYYRSRYADSD